MGKKLKSDMSLQGSTQEKDSWTAYRKLLSKEEARPKLPLSMPNFRIADILLLRVGCVLNVPSRGHQRGLCY